MAKRKYYIGTVGPFVYDDSDTYADGESVAAFRVTDEDDNTLLRVVGAPVDNEDALRKEDAYVNWVSPPASETSAGSPHDMAEDGDYLYVFSSVTSKWMRFRKTSWSTNSGELIGLGMFTYA